MKPLRVDEDYSLVNLKESVATIGRILINGKHVSCVIMAQLLWSDVNPWVLLMWHIYCHVFWCHRDDATQCDGICTITITCRWIKVMFLWFFTSLSKHGPFISVGEYDNTLPRVSRFKVNLLVIPQHSTIKCELLLLRKTSTL